MGRAYLTGVAEEFGIKVSFRALKAFQTAGAAVKIVDDILGRQLRGKTISAAGRQRSASAYSTLLQRGG
ncbi:hypothetical protein TNCV_3472371 [Trichonephila clavipes]|nr:hypothetical protein TNCV_3472371 [Trichonephila clavipes]